MTHRSFAPSPGESSERLEFLGDALLGAYVARFLLDALPPDTGEDVLSRARVFVIRRETLAHAARELGLPDLLLVGNGERIAGRHHHDSLLADAYEALVAAQFLDCGPDAMDAFIRQTLSVPLQSVSTSPPPPDPKTLLQMRLQSEGRGLPTYHTVEATGTGHDHHFTVEARDASGTVLGRGEGANQRAAQMEAARAALSALPA